MQDTFTLNNMKIYDKSTCEASFQICRMITKMCDILSPKFSLSNNILFHNNFSHNQKLFQANDHIKLQINGDGNNFHFDK